MNLVTDALTPNDVASLRGIVTGLVRDADAGQSVTWYAASARAYNPSSGTVGYSGASATFTAFLGPAEADEAEGVKAGDVQLLVLVSDVAAPAVDDRFTVSSIPYVVTKVEPSPLPSVHTLVYARRVP